MTEIKEYGCSSRTVGRVKRAVAVGLMNVGQQKYFIFLTMADNQNRYRKQQYLFASKQKREPEGAL